MHPGRTGPLSGRARRPPLACHVHSSQARQRDERFDQLYSELMEGRQELLPRADEVVSHQQEWRRKKMRDTHSNWTTQVFEPIRDTIKTAVSQRSAREIEERLREQYDEYLKVTNEKAGVFR